LAYLTAIVRAFKTVFGLGDSSAKKATKSVASLGASVGDVSTGLGTATKKAKELKKTIAGFDELEILNGPEDDSGSGGGGGVISGGGGGGYDVGSYFDPEDWELPDVSAFEASFTTALENLKKKFDDLTAAIAENTAQWKEKFDWTDILKLAGLAVAIGKIWPWLKKLGLMFGALLVEFLTTVKNVEMPLGMALVNGIKYAFWTIGKIIKKSINTFIADFKVWLGTWTGTITAIVTLLVAGFITMWNKSEDFRKKVTDAVKTLTTYLKNVFTNLWNGSLKPLWDHIKNFVASIIALIKSIMSFVKELWQSVLAPIFGYIAAGIATLVGGIIAALTGLLAKITGIVADILSVVLMICSQIIQSVSGVIDGITTTLKNFWAYLGIIMADIRQIFTALGTFLNGVFTGNWAKAWQGIKDIVSGAGTAIKHTINGIISFIENLINGVVRALNRINWNIKLPSWLPVVGGKSWGFGLNLSTISLPRLANGAVLQENTIAQLGEYANAHNNPEIVTPENLMRDIFTESQDDLVVLLDRNNRLLEQILEKNVSISIGDDVISAAAARGDRDYKKRTGRSQFA
jgi:hypothetical protein